MFSEERCGQTPVIWLCTRDTHSNLHTPLCIHQHGFMSYSCTVLCGLSPCVNSVYSVKYSLKYTWRGPSLSTIGHKQSSRDGLTCSSLQDNLWQRRSSWFWDGTLWRHCSQGEDDVSGFFVERVESQRAWLLISEAQKPHSQFPPALYSSVYSELWEADEAFSLLILRAQSDKRWSIYERQKTAFLTKYHVLSERFPGTIVQV